MILLLNLFEVCILLPGQLRYGRCQNQLVRGYDDGDVLCYDCMVAITITLDARSLMIRVQCITAWFYPGQPEVRDMVACTSIHPLLSTHNFTAHNSMLAARIIWPARKHNSIYMDAPQVYIY